MQLFPERCEKKYFFFGALNFWTQRTARFYTLACVYARTHEQAARWKEVRRKMMLQFASESSRNRARELPGNIRFTLRWIPMPNIKGREEFSSSRRSSARSQWRYTLSPSFSTLCSSLLFPFPTPAISCCFCFSPTTARKRGPVAASLAIGRIEKRNAANAEAPAHKVRARRRRMENTQSTEHRWPNSEKRIPAR